VSNRQCRACRLLRYKFDPEATKARRLKRYAENKESERAYQQGWVKKNQAYVAADCLARYYANPVKEKARRRLSQSMRRAAYKRPYVEPYRKAIKAIYEEAERLQQETGIKHHVDHVVPLKGKNVLACMCPGT
jgi:5-methylcytosine-specific restriction endonuclease McrA